MEELWTCPRCERSFANRNQWHSCISLALDEHLASKTDRAVAIYRTLESALRDCGEFRVHPQKTRVAFIARMTFAGVRLARRWGDVSFILDVPVDDTRIRKLEMYGPTSFGHEIRINRVGEIDGEVRRWLRRAHVRGTQETLDPQAKVAPLVGRLLELLTVPLRSRAVKHDDGLALTAPGYAVDVLGAHRRVRARTGGAEFDAEIVPTGAGGRIVFASDALLSLGLGDGDEADVFLSANL